MKKILVVGSQGYLGSRLTDYLMDLGYSVKGLDIGLFQYGVLYYPKNVETEHKNAKDICDADIQGFDVVVQLAGISNDPLGGVDPSQLYDPTRVYTKNIAEICKRVGARFIFPSSCSIYGIGQSMSDENSIVNPQTGYSLNKVQIEEDLASLADETFSPIALRLATVFGPSPRIRFDVVINMLTAMAVTEKKIVLNSNGKAWRPHLHIEDACQALRCCIDWDYDGDELLVLNVGRDDNNWQILDIAKYLNSIVSESSLHFLASDEPNELIKDRKIQDGVDIRNYKVSFEKINDVLPNFKCKWGVKEGIDDLILDFHRLGLNEIKFKQTDFYRLQQVEHLNNTSQLKL